MSIEYKTCEAVGETEDGRELSILWKEQIDSGDNWTPGAVEEFDEEIFINSRPVAYNELNDEEKNLRNHIKRYNRREM